VDKIIRHSFELGVSDAQMVSVEKISIEAHLVKLCEEPRCNGYGQSASCPPNVMKPDRFREHLRQYESALVFKFDVPPEMLLRDDRREINKVIHETAAGIETFARNRGYKNSEGLAAGSCKRLFCDKHEKCNILSNAGDCRFPNLARPSMSGLGINFFELAKVLGWQISKITRDSHPDDIPMGLMAGMVLIG